MDIWLWFMSHAGENTCYLYICYNLFTAGGVSLHGELLCRGSFRAYRLSSSKRRRMLELTVW